MARFTNNSNRKLAFQGLEERRLMAGDVAVAVSDGDLMMAGDSHENSVTMIQAFQAGMPVPGRFYVRGLNGTTINGGTGGFMAEGVTRNFHIDLKDGSDYLVLGDSHPFTVPNDLNINLGDGYLNHAVLDGITVRDDVAIFGGTGTDNVTIKRTTIGNVGADANRNDLTINTGLGAESVLLQYTSVQRNVSVNTGGDALANRVDMYFTNIENDLTINTGLGADTVNLQNAFVRRNVSIDTGNDFLENHVDMYFANVGKDVTIRTGFGADKVTLSNVGVNNELKIETRDGKDDVTLYRSEADVLSVTLGGGDDKLSLREMNGRKAMLDGGTGINTYFETGTLFTQGRSRAGF